MPFRKEQVARNESLFREVNERIKQVNVGLVSSEECDFLCECGDRDCMQPVTMTLSEYEEVRSESTYFAVAPGHVDPDVERVVAENDRFVTVEKVAPEAVEIVEDDDPRS